MRERADMHPGLQAQFKRAYRDFLLRRGMVEEENGGITWPLAREDGFRHFLIGEGDHKRRFIRKRQLELGEDPDEFRDEPAFS